MSQTDPASPLTSDAWNSYHTTELLGVILGVTDGEAPGAGLDAGGLDAGGVAAGLEAGGLEFGGDADGDGDTGTQVT
jgi:hypothetical protein